ncbi:response regulator [Chitinophaga sp. 22321]|uniref:Response regulator transcription factor n=1 Tax=Chitinophaga hostae TaxID=2831022 RepID=A0ABS5IUU3_9BACT|nr:response regulator transcription factor [Chitinophaga hostae]MBS0026541.1 response regulator transcription factor [Chitinophaga hostae]
MSHSKKTIAIVDDHPIVLDGLVQLLDSEDGFIVSGSFTKGQFLLDFLKNNQPDIILLDIGLPDINGLELFDSIKMLAPGTIILTFSNYIERSAITQMLGKGVNGYISKSTPPMEIIRCLYRALEGQLALSPEVEYIVKSEKQLSSDEQAVRISVREREILLLIASGITSSQIAKKLFLSKFTINNHRKNLLQKLKVKNVAELISEATRLELI